MVSYRSGIENSDRAKEEKEHNGILLAVAVAVTAPSVGRSAGELELEASDAGVAGRRQHFPRKQPRSLARQCNAMGNERANNRLLGGRAKGGESTQLVEFENEYAVRS